MQLALVRDQDKEQLIEQRLGLTCTSPEDFVAELLRSELAARGVCGRRSLCDRVVKLLESTAPVNRDFVKDILLSLEKAGDVSIGPNGQIGATPLRAVKLADNKFQLYGTVTHHQLVTLFAQSKLSGGITHVLGLKGRDRQNFHEVLNELGGLELSPERWAGMDKIGAADQAWLDGLDDRLAMQSRPAGSFDQEARDDWQNYRSDKAKLMQKARWQKKDISGKGNLWRIWHARGWPIYCWTDGESPEQAEQIRLSADEANRTMFALDKVSGAGISCKISERKNKIHMQIGGFVPRAEYRYLITKGMFTGKDGDYFCFQFNTAMWKEVSELLNERLGIPG